MTGPTDPSPTGQAPAGGTGGASPTDPSPTGQAPAGGTGGASPPTKHRCPGCGYVYDEAAGHAREGFPPGTPWSEVPDDFVCPDCGVRDKLDFERER